jgi:hypothetical protein
MDYRHRQCVMFREEESFKHRGHWLCWSHLAFWLTIIEFYFMEHLLLQLNMALLQLGKRDRMPPVNISNFILPVHLNVSKIFLELVPHGRKHIFNVDSGCNYYKSIFISLNILLDIWGHYISFRISRVSLVCV